MSVKHILFLATGALLCACSDENIQFCANLIDDPNKQPLAESYCEKAAKNGDAQSQKHYAELLLKQGDKPQAVEFLEKSANQKNGEAMFRLAELYADEADKAKFYYQQSCQVGILKSCERVEAINNQRDAQFAAEREALAQEKAAAEAKLQAEREKLAQQQAEEQAKLEAERLKLAAEKAQTVKAEHFFMNSKEAEEAYREVIKVLSKNGDGANEALRQWIENCYSRSSHKLGCFHFDQWISILDERISKANNEEINPYFGDSRVRNRALRNIPELQNITTAEFNRLVADTREKLVHYEDRFFQMWQEEDKRRTQQAVISPPNSAKVETSKLKFNEGLAKYQQNGLWGFVNQRGEIVISPQFLAVGGFYHGRAVVQAANKNWGYIDKQGNWIVTPQFCMAGRFSEGLAGVYVNGYRDMNGDCQGGKWGFITPSGTFAINPIFERAQGFHKPKGQAAKAKVEYQGQAGFINGKGQWLESLSAF